jgi:hypothetical protein
MLTIACKTYVWLVLVYGGELLPAASENMCKALVRVQNKALRLITKSAPVASMEIQTEIEPVTIIEPTIC